jgi:hypothetical protein
MCTVLDDGNTGMPFIMQGRKTLFLHGDVAPDKEGDATLEE